MVSDSIRAIKMVKSSEAVQKYEMTYQSSIDELIPYGSDKEAYEKRIQEIIKNLSKRTQYYVSSFPLFNKNNSLLYDLIHCTSNKEGFKLFKKCAWKTFEGKSSNKNLHGNDQLIVLNFDDLGESTRIFIDSYCYNILNIVDYLYQNFKGQKNVMLKELWECLDNHPIFPTDGFKKMIKNELVARYNVNIHKSTIDF